MVIADRAAILVKQVYGHYNSYGFLELAIASVLFAFQIYCDFWGYTNIARGAAQVMGFSLMQNFRQPYLATSIKDFWRRWHISLTLWFTDYLYIPLGGSKKGIIRQHLNTFIVFGISGLWHGASWHFVTWGVLHACYQIIGNIKKQGEKILAQFGGYSENTVSRKLSKGIITFILVDFAWIFFASDSLSHAYGILWQMFTTFQTTSVYEIGLDRGNWFMLCFGIILLLAVDIVHERGKSIFSFVNRQMFWFRWTLYLGLIWGTILFGVYGIDYDSSQFIYFQF